ncbi:hypothetical protein [Reyranella sp.]|jgi:hypothetical protein|uniref:hypothetical protein n=1 Tax=Reyranella sp. TaxID=1929291 RepID=UPI000BDA03A8|nr:hypothetical protein [Reyranella sp.]OYY41360.1 MAG: hypothetical protein B7Y57_14775 [Rhodospirillales bacterium 35-66-84]OYZ93558.1 MAG: hypothetical protein B7Y08_16850 [Rhodospirillales bacterium 24-66-33]OZB21747.1 MAG: hypothetical protein B7X63_25415 [Rhodospirillales bacterium 39-66-50]HQS16266.1 hypothetical protein [Reyranella sp.]HQT12097.1 hypothetical protein [Reyranella sp.]
MSPLLILLVIALVAFALLLKFGAGGGSAPTKIVTSAMAAINVAGTLGLGWFVVEILTHDGVVMVVELSACASLMALLAALTGGGLVLARRGRIRTGMALLAVGALPAVFVYGFLVYLDANPIDWR